MHLPHYNFPVFESHIAGKLREKYGLSQFQFSERGKLTLLQFHEVRLLALNVNKHRPKGRKVFAGELLAASLLDQAYHIVIRDYENFAQKDVFREALHWVSSKTPADYVQRLLIDFVFQFPAESVYKGQCGAIEWLSKKLEWSDNRSLALKELLMLTLANKNPANYHFRELFDRNHLDHQAFLDEIMVYLEMYFVDLQVAMPGKPDLISRLREPIQHAPDNLYAQLEYVLYHWADLLPEGFVMRLLQGRDFIKEDYQLHGNTGGIPTFVPQYKQGVSEGTAIGKSGFDFGQHSVSLYNEYKAFTPDTHWMPKVVLISKNTLVWLDQLSKAYQRDITRLDQIPDEELDRLSRWGINCLWLIGLWERSDASRKIKHINGYQDVVSSAYSLFDYEIAHNLGGEDAYQNLNQRAKAKGIRLASDMVPNHTGVFSRWIIDHPDFFIQTPVSPFPGYQFAGPSLSDHPDIELRIDDGYYNKTDAAVVFQRIDRRTGDIRYIYHGNDGTNMPWNDTAQLDMLKSEVREAVISKIFEVARRFSVIRFDAAMTLVKKHFARLWYPSPGTGGDIPSRSDFAMMQTEFESYFPKEFWREVVDRINTHMPETLLLAEAFWLMEGYFVRTLGMHRVYNSAFMHMLKKEENSKYRELIINTLEFEPEILKRYVNFMSNPDEDTAINQFGSGDKYFGVCVLMCTLPGLPMFAHGQIEGFHEKYGMEYKRAYHDEIPQQWFLDRHKREIFPLLAKRYLFSDVEHFNFFAAIEDGSNAINENVFAFSNRINDERVLVLYNNRFDRAQGFITKSYPKLNAEGSCVEADIVDALALKLKSEIFYVVQEHVSGRYFIFQALDLQQKGWRFFLNGFEYKLFWNFKEVTDHKGVYNQLAARAGSEGISDLNREVLVIENHKVYLNLHELLKPESVEAFAFEIFEKAGPTSPPSLSRRGQDLLRKLCQEIETATGRQLHVALVLDTFSEYLNFLAEFLRLAPSSQVGSAKSASVEFNQMLLPFSLDTVEGVAQRAGVVAIYLITLESIKKGIDNAEQIPDLLEILSLQFGLSYSLQLSGYSDSERENIVLLAALAGDFCLAFPNVARELTSKTGEGLHTGQAERNVVNQLFISLQGQKALKFIGVNYYQEEWFFHKESAEELLGWFLSLVVFDKLKSRSVHFDGKPDTDVLDLLTGMENLYIKISSAANSAGYKLSAFLDALHSMVVES